MCRHGARSWVVVLGFTLLTVGCGGEEGGSGEPASSSDAASDVTPEDDSGAPAMDAARDAGARDGASDDAQSSDTTDTRGEVTDGGETSGDGGTGDGERDVDGDASDAGDGSVSDASPPEDGSSEKSDGSVDGAGGEDATCEPSCDGRECGPDGCGGQCGTCDPSEMCDGAGQCVCEPDCSNKACGDDGCGGSCGTCSGAQVCNASQQCEYPSTSFANDVMPIFNSAGCAASTCHGGANPQAGLDLGSTSVAYNDLVSVPSSQCGSSRLRVDPNSPSTSYLIDKLEGQNMCLGTQMPKNQPPLGSAQIDTIRAWIGNGAPNN